MNGVCRAEWKEALLIGIDVGSSHCKVGLVEPSGKLARLETGPMTVQRGTGGQSYYEPEEVWQTVLQLLHRLIAGEPSAEAIGQSPHSYSALRSGVLAIGVSSMAESGVLLSRSTGRAYTRIIPWFDPRGANGLSLILDADSPQSIFARTGLHPAAKHSLAKLLWLQREGGGIPDDAVWLSVADFIVYRLTATMATDYTLAARTLCFDIRHRVWDRDWLRDFQLSAQLFPDPLPSGVPVGVLLPDVSERLGLSGQIPVCIAGHDHLCGLAGAGLPADTILNSVGTAETLLGLISPRELGKTEFDTGLAYGLHVTGDAMYWMGSLPMSGASVEWARRFLVGQDASYDAMLLLLRGVQAGEANAIYVPALAQSGAGPNWLQHGSLFGLTQLNDPAALLQVVLEGLCFEVQYIRSQAERALSRRIERFSVIGGGARSREWLQIKADITGCVIDVLPAPESAVVGAALVAARGSKLITASQRSEDLQALSREPGQTRIWPQIERQSAYRRIYEDRYLPLRSLAQEGLQSRASVFWHGGDSHE